ncbi:MAG: antitoxin, RHH family protein [Elusimicrobia bacterium]|nr:antitoxin, RHH family protein [Elusimicrobiota bacterium]
MPAKNPRVNIVLDQTLYNVLGRMAQRDGISMSLEARDLIKEALEAKEDIYWDIVASERKRTYSAKKALSHKDIWK